MNATEMFVEKIAQLAEREWRKPDELLSFEIRPGENFEGIECWMGLKFVKVRRAHIERAAAQGEEALDTLVKKIYYNYLRGKPLIPYQPEQFTRLHLMRRALDTIEEVLLEAWGREASDRFFGGVEKDMRKICKDGASQVSQTVQSLRLAKAALVKIMARKVKVQEDSQ